jgi:hypothetical protein
MLSAAAFAAAPASLARPTSFAGRAICTSPTPTRAARVTSLRRRVRFGVRMQDVEGDSAEDQAPSDSFVPAAKNAAQALGQTVEMNLGGRADLVGELLAVAAVTARGQFATRGQREKVEGFVAKLEAENPNEAPVESDLIDGDWVLVYSSTKLLEKSPLLALFIKPVIAIGQIRQSIAVDEGRLVTEVDITSFPEISSVYKSTSRITPVGGERLEVTVEKSTVTGGSIANRFDLGGLSFDIPVEQIYQRLKGSVPELFIDTTYLDDTIRISRGKNSKMFVFARA